jgi:integrase
MPKVHLTDTGVRALKPEANVTYWDKRLSGFGIRVGLNRKTWTVLRGRQRERITIGHFPDMPLAAARRKAMTLLGNIDPSPTRVPFDEAFEQFLDRHGRSLKPRSLKELERTIRKHFLPGLEKKTLDKITHNDIAVVLDDLRDRPGEAMQAFKNIRTFFNWTVPRYISHSPCEGMRPPAKYVPRQRVLSDSELVSVWRAADELGYPFGTLVKLLALTGQRKDEMRTLRFDYIDRKSNTITLPETKNGRRHTFPFGNMLLSVLAEVPHNSGFVFAGKRSGELYNCGGNPKHSIDRLAPIAPWTLHDLRRTFATNLAGLKVQPHVVEKILNHASGTISGVAAIYNRFQYADDMRAAITAWEARLTSLLNSHPAN